jgi:serine/threonine protein kinase
MNPSHTAAEGDGAPERIGEVFAGKYRIVRLLGEGGMGRVYEAEHTSVGRRFAVKLLRRHLAANPQALARFRREARAAGALENEHIAAVLDFDAAPDGAPFLVMEYLEGRSLGQLLAEEGPLPVSRAANALLQVCRGLEAAHAAGILHRDLKPDNLFVTRRADGSEQVKILDFGIAKLLGERTDLAPIQTGAAIGTPFYMAPEQVRGDAPLDERVDIYALGVIFYELLSGQKPHPGDSGNTVLAHVLTQSPARLETLRPGLPRGVVELVHRALAFDPRDRPASVRALAREIEGLVPPEMSREPGRVELRAAAAASLGANRDDVRATAPTLPTPDSSAVSSGIEAPRARASSPTKLWIAAGLLATVAAAFAYRAVSGTDVPAAPERELSSANVTVPSSGVPEPTSAAALPPASGRLSEAAASPPPVEPGPNASGRPRGRPPGARSNPSSAAAPAVSPAARAPDAASPAVPGGADGDGRIRFDARNPYE